MNMCHVRRNWSYEHVEHMNTLLHVLGRGEEMVRDPG